MPEQRAAILLNKTTAKQKVSTPKIRGQGRQTERLSFCVYMCVYMCGPPKLNEKNRCFSFVLIFFILDIPVEFACVGVCVCVCLY